MALFSKVFKILVLGNQTEFSFRPAMPPQLHIKPISSFLPAWVNFIFCYEKVRSLQLQQEPIFNLFRFFFLHELTQLAIVAIAVPKKLTKVRVKLWSSLDFTCKTTPGQRLSCDMPRELLPGCTVPGTVLFC